MINNKIKISIITVSYNSVKTIKDTIESILFQDYTDIECIIIDGDSTDGTLDIIRQYKDKISYFISEPDKGIYDAMNKGIKIATGNVIGILNSDDLYSSNQVLSNVASIFKETDCDCLYGDLVYVDKVDTSKIVRYWKSGMFSKKKLRMGWMLPHPTFFVKKEIYNNYGLYSLKLKSAADYEMILRLLHEDNIKIEYFQEVLVNMRMGGKSNFSFLNRLKGNYEDNLAWDMNNLRKPLFIRLFKPLRKVNQFFKKPKI